MASLAVRDNNRHSHLYFINENSQVKIRSKITHVLRVIKNRQQVMEIEPMLEIAGYNKSVVEPSLLTSRRPSNVI